MNNVVVFNGAQSALFNIILSFCNSGGRWRIEPFFDAYQKGAMLVGADVKGAAAPAGRGSSTAADFSLGFKRTGRCAE